MHGRGWAPTIQLVSTQAPAPVAEPYPRASDVDVALRDGSTVRIRPVLAADRPAVVAFLGALSAQSMAFRFFGQPSLEWAADWATDVDYADRYALIAATGPGQEVIAHGAYVRTGPDRAEVAFTVADEWQGSGIATIMLAHLALAADAHGIEIFTAQVLPANHRMIEVFRDSGFPLALHSGEGLIEVELPTSSSPDTRERFHQRERIAAIAAAELFLRPRSVAVIGASPRRRTVGGEILHNLRGYGFRGHIYPVNRRVATIGRRRAYASIGDVPEPVDLAVIAVPAAQVCSVARECALAGTRGLLVISAGFAEIGGEGFQRQRELLEICRQAGMRLVGPNCLGVINTAEDVCLDATFIGRSPPRGSIAFLSQSGGLGIAIVEAASRMGLGLSSFVSNGNKADVSGNDLLEFWEQDPGTRVLLLYVEQFGNPRRFARIARRVGAGKPIVAVKSGRTPAGARATSSHTGALLSASDVTVDALFRQAGVIRTDTMQELFDVGGLLARQPAPAGPRVAIVTNAGGPGILCADACQAAGLEVAELAPAARKRLAAFLAPEASLGNPIDMVATAPAVHYRKTIQELIAGGACDAIVAIFVPPLVTRAEDAAREIAVAARDLGGVTLTAVFMNSEGAPPQLGAGGTVPTFDFPEDAARALGHAAGYAAWRARPAGSVPELDGIRPDEAAAIVSSALARGGGWLQALEVNALLDCYGLPTIETSLAADAAEAAAAAARLGGPVALKGIAAGLLHKSDAGAVRVGLGAGEVRAAAGEIEAAVSRAGHRMEGLLVQPMAPSGVELLMGVVHDESFGPVIACGAGGTATEILGDVAVRITPLTDLDAGEMLRSLKTFRLLEGFRGAPRCDVAAVEDALLRLSALVEEHPAIAELDANPIVVSPRGAVIVDARVRIAAVAAPPPRPSL
jgi:acetyl coenzyme A synthetase (ADP forming)-like protein